MVDIKKKLRIYFPINLIYRTNIRTMTQKLTIDEICHKLELADLSGFRKPGRNKGRRGQQLELALGVANSSSLTDLEDGEIKSFTVGESIAVTQLKHCLHEIITHKTSFQDSKVGTKIRNTLYIALTEMVRSGLGTARASITDFSKSPKTTNTP